MKLPFGQLNGELVHITEVGSGKSKVICPFCQAQLIAKKGSVKQHHFSHQKTTICNYSFTNQLFSLTGQLSIHLSLSVFASQKQQKINTIYRQLKTKLAAITQTEQLINQLKYELNNLKRVGGIELAEQLIQQVNRFVSQQVAPFPSFHLLRNQYFSEGYTDGKQVCNTDEINNERYEFYYPIRFKKYVKLLQEYHFNKSSRGEGTRAKLAILNEEITYFKRFTLYFFKISANERIFYKIGLTSRSLEIRRKEILNDLKRFFIKIDLELLYQRADVAFLERFFKQKYIHRQLNIGQFTEYFSFSEKEVTLILLDLNLLRFLRKKPSKNSIAWIDWLFFNSNKKLYGSSPKVVYVHKEKYFLDKNQEQRFRYLIDLKKE